MNEQDSDERLVELVLTGKREAFALLVERYQRTVFAIARRVLGDSACAADAAQNAFVTAYEKLPSLRRGAVFGTWLLTIARREACNIQRARMRSVPLDDACDQALEVTGPVASGERIHQLVAAMEHLPAHEQQVLMLRYYDGQSVAAVAQITGRSVGTVTKQISRGLARLRTRLKEHLNE